MSNRTGLQAMLGAVFLASAAPAAAQAEPQLTSMVPEGAYTRTRVLQWTTLGLGVLHHIDHGLRDNHSGFPFRSELSPYTASLLIYPITLAGLYYDMGPLYFTILDSLAIVGIVATHVAIEPPSHIYDPWTDGSNRLGVRSPVMGGMALGLLSALGLSLSATLAAHVIDGVRYGFTWKRRPVGTPISASTITLGMTPDRQLALSGCW